MRCAGLGLACPPESRSARLSTPRGASDEKGGDAPDANLLGVHPDHATSRTTQPFGHGAPLAPSRCARSSRCTWGRPGARSGRTSGRTCLWKSMTFTVGGNSKIESKIAHAHIRTASEVLFPFPLLNSHFRSSRFSRNLKEGNCLYRASVDW